MNDVERTLSRGQQVGLVLLRTLIGWHFLYEGYFKLLRPAWSRDGSPLAAWTSAGYLHAANGPFAALFHRLADSPWIGRVDTAVAAALILVGLSLTLGIFTQAGCAGGLALALHAFGEAWGRFVGVVGGPGWVVGWRGWCGDDAGGQGSFLALSLASCGGRPRQRFATPAQFRERQRVWLFWWERGTTVSE